MQLGEMLGIKDRELITCVGAGGKSSLLMSLGREWQSGQRRFLLTTTTRMFDYQVQSFAPVVCGEYESGAAQVCKTLEQFGFAGWFRDQQQEKMLGLPPEWIDSFYQSFAGAEQGTTVLVEGDGARQRLLKIPAPHEPVIPGASTKVIGVLSLSALGQKLSPEVAHRYELVTALLKKEPGEIIKPRDFAILAGNEAGIFRGCVAEKVLVLTGGNAALTAAADEIVAEIKKAGSRQISACVVTTGFGTSMRAFLTYKL